MECLYFPDLTEETKEVVLSGEEYKHAKALRLKISDQVLITNGKGLTAVCLFTDFDKSGSKFTTISFLHNSSEPEKKVIAAVGITDNKDRFEFALEKSVELGVSAFIPLITEYSAQKNYNNERLKAKAIAAMKQCKRSILPDIFEPIMLSDLLSAYYFDQIIIADPDGKSEIEYTDNILVAVGPEGGFSDTELAIFKTNEAELLKLGNRRLRTETALLATLTKILL